MSNLFALKSVRNKPHRDGFDLGFKNIFTAPIGALLPVMYKDTMPGDKFKIDLSWFTRSQPVTAPAYTRLTEYVDFFYVPMHFLWRYFPDFITQTNSNNWAKSVNDVSEVTYTSHPYFTTQGISQYLNKLFTKQPTYSTGGPVYSSRLGMDIFGQNLRLFHTKRLLEMLNMGIVTIVRNTNTSSGQPLYSTYEYSFGGRTDVTAVNPFPLLAYNKIYQDFYRNSQWEKPLPRNYNLDYVTPDGSLEVNVSNMLPYDNSAAYDTAFDLKFCNYNKDFFTGALPSKQYGTEAIAAPLLNPDGSTPNFSNLTIYASTTSGGSNTQPYFFPQGKQSSTSQPAPNSISSILNNLGIGALAVRQAEFLQKWKEITMSGGTDYVAQMEKHFGVKPNSDMAHRCTYLGGCSKNFGADEVVNTNLADGNEATIMGKMVNVGNGKLECSFKEHGILMAIYHISSLPIYDQQFTDPLLFKTNNTDYVIPELDNIGMQSVNARSLATRTSSAIGYQPRYSEYKSSVDQIHGAFTSVYRNWVTPVTDNVLGLFAPLNGQNIAELSPYARFKVCPNLLDNVFNVRFNGDYSTDQFFVNMDFGIKAVRNISRDGLPY